ncbi:MAG TPA: c-type cytochrome [Rhizomicrobium sp.]|nr:c-type cytochrome [Rhizomicrobium sp.]
MTGHWKAGLCIAGAVALAGLAEAQVASPPPFAFPVPPPGTPAPATTDEIAHLPGSTAAFTLKQVRDGFNVADWFPQDHPRMPAYVAHGHSPDVRGCAYCHLPNGQGRPENASLAGQPSAYIVEQVVAMREGRRHSSVPQMGPPAAMLALSQHAKDADIKIAGDYFAGLKFHKWIRVVETDMAPKTFVDGTSMLTATPDGAKEKLAGDRLLEMPENVARTELRDPRSGFVAYVPKGSIAHGKALVQSDAGRLPCAVCHGDDYKGAAGTPSLAGRSPSYLIRQMYDIQHGARGGPALAPMKAEVAKLKQADMVAIAAYLASREP